MNLPAWKTPREAFGFIGDLLLIARLIVWGLAIVVTSGWVWDGLAYFNIVALAQTALAALPAKLWALTGL